MTRERPKASLLKNVMIHANCTNHKTLKGFNTEDRYIGLFDDSDKA